jgi:hypothetical protein
MTRETVQCPYCEQKANRLLGKDGVPRIAGWVRYGCGNEHKFALPPEKSNERARAA